MAKEMATGGRNEAADAARFVAELKDTADQLLADGADRGDLKMLARSLQEMRDALAMLQPYRKLRKVTVFGSARTHPNNAVYQLAAEFGRVCADRGYMVVTGAGPGIMEAAHVGAGRERSIGFNIRLPFEQGANAVIEGDPKLKTLNYFFTRKLLFVKESDAVVLFPGGFGTLDEGFEALTLLQTGKAESLPVVLVDVPGGRYWQEWHAYIRHQLLEPGLISPEDLSLVRLTDNVTDAIEEIDRFYRIYHSQRYIGNSLYIRMQKPLPDPLFERLCIEFADILAPEGRFSRVEAHRFEENEPDIRHLPRLRVGFNRRSFGRLRELINFLNMNV